jgi:rubrerythrin
MELGTFGAIVSFAIGLEDRATAFYDAAAQATQSETLGELARGSHKRLDRLTRARQELVAEMILESITGLTEESYAVELDSTADEASLMGQARNLEETSMRFYQDAADKLPIREVVRLFTRMAQENEKRLAKLG